MKKVFSLLALVSVNFSAVWCSAQGYVSPFKTKDGQVVLKSRDEIRNEEYQRSSAQKLNLQREFDKPTKKQARENGEIWIGNYCRYRPASYRTSNFDGDLTEAAYQREDFPADTVFYSDDFKEKGNIPWEENTYNEAEAKACVALRARIATLYQDGIPFQMYDSLTRLSNFFSTLYRGKRTGRAYEFSRANSIWIKRKEGPEKMPFTLNATFAFVNSKDYLEIEMNDLGKFTIKSFCDNGDPQMSEVKSGKAKTWKTGDWNELTVRKDEFNNILVYANEELILQYKTPNIPVATRFASFRLSMPYQWEKKGLQYQIGGLASISYPKSR